MPTLNSVFVTPGREADYNDFHYAHAVRAGDLLFVSGQTGAGPDGVMPEGVTAQSEAAFEAIGAALAAAGLTFENVVSLTSYHVGNIQRDIWDFFAVKEKFIAAPYPAWTAVGASDLAHAGALVEVAAVATFS